MKTKELLFAVSLKDSKGLHLYLLPGQTLKGGSPVDISFKIQGDRDERAKYSPFSIFALEKNSIHISSTKKNYIGATKSAIVEVIENIFVETAEPKKIELKKYKDKDELLSEYISYTRIGSNINLNVVTPTDTISAVYAEGLRPYILKKDSSTSTTTGETTSDKPKEETTPPSPWIDEIIKKEKLKCPSSSGDGFFLTTKDWKLLIRNIKRQVNTLITGPAGTGKTSCIKYAAEKLGLPLYTFDMGAMMDPISSLLGVHRLQDGHSIFDYAQFTKVIQEPCIILLDELNRAPMGVGNILFPCLDDRRTLPVEIAGGTDMRSIKIHPEVTFIATANIGAEYTGTSVLDRALTNRFFPLELTYLPESEEKKVLLKRTGIEDKEAELIVKVANTIRTMNKKMELSMSVSVRETLMISNLVKDGWSLGDAMKTVYLPMFEGNKTEGERSKVFKVLASY